MSIRWILSCSSAVVLAVCLAGCGGASSTSQNPNAPDPVQEAIEKNVQSKGPQEVPPGYMMNSGGEIVPAGDKNDSDNQ
jgi:hypothetical protein